MGGAVTVHQIGLVTGGHEPFVVDEEHDGWHRDDAVFFEGGGGCVVEFEAFAEFFIDGRGVGFEGRMEDAVEGPVPGMF